MTCRTFARAETESCASLRGSASKPTGRTLRVGAANGACEQEAASRSVGSHQWARRAVGVYLEHEVARTYMRGHDHGYILRWKPCGEPQ
jgi:hypothetical protein